MRTHSRIRIRIQIQFKYAKFIILSYIFVLIVKLEDWERKILCSVNDIYQFWWAVRMEKLKLGLAIAPDHACK